MGLFFLYGQCINIEEEELIRKRGTLLKTKPKELKFNKADIWWTTKGHQERERGVDGRNNIWKEKWKRWNLTVCGQPKEWTRSNQLQKRHTRLDRRRKNALLAYEELEKGISGTLVLQASLCRTLTHTHTLRPAKGLK